MTVTAVQTVVTHVVLMTKLDWLLAFNPLPCVPGRAIQLRRHPKRGNEDKNSSIDRQLC